MTKVGYLGFDVLVDLFLAAANDQVRRYAKPAELSNGSLSRFGLVLPRGIGLWDQRHVNRAKVFTSDAKLKLAESLNEGHALDVSDGSSQLDDADFGRIHLVADRNRRYFLHPFLYGVGDVGNHLHRFPEVITAPFLIDHRLVDFPGGDVVVPVKRDVQKPVDSF